MKRISTLIFAILVAFTFATVAEAADDLGRKFSSPPDEYRPWVYWWWLNGNTTQEGITRDLEEMKKAGIGGALLFDAGGADPKDVPRGPAFMSPQWREMFKYALREAKRCGIVLSANLCSGWCAGGPWVTPEHATKALMRTQNFVKGPVRVSLDAPKAQDYRDVCVIAVPIKDPAFSPYELAPYKLVASSKSWEVASLEDLDSKTIWNSDKLPAPTKPEYLQFTFESPYTAAAIHLEPRILDDKSTSCGPKDIDVQCSDDGKAFRTLVRMTLNPNEKQTISFEPARAKIFRVLFLSAYPDLNGKYRNVQVATIAIFSKEQLANKDADWPPRWSRQDAIDLTSYVDSAGRLSWDAPAGLWRIECIGSKSYGEKTDCVGSGPGGLEIDPMSAEAMDFYFAETGAKMIADAGEEAGKTFQYVCIDSWEIGQPSWTPKMRQEFQKRRGYDPMLWLPALLNTVVDSPEASERFRCDYRRTLADLIAENYYGRLNQLALKGGLKGAHSEAAGPTGGHFFWGDGLKNLGVNAIPMGEFWKRQSEPDGDIFYGPYNHTIRQAASAAHIYGKPVCQAEAFTSFAYDFIEAPWDLKDIGDAAFCDGLTRNVLCLWVNQAKPDIRPGFQWPHIGTHFGYTVTWWPMADAWIKYLARCQYMLRQGDFVADFAYLMTEDPPSFATTKMKQEPMRPAGFDYDAINAEVLLTRASAKEGRLILPGGMSYRYLVLPHDFFAFLTDTTLKKINELADAGVNVIAPASFAPAVPKARVTALDAAVKADGLLPDIEFRNLPPATFDWLHRRTADADIYFISNQSKHITKDMASEVVFRVAGRQPELWDPVTGRTRALLDFRTTEDGRTAIPLTFAPRQSGFVVFKSKDEGRRLKDEGARKNFPELKPVEELTGPWEVQFDSKWFYPDNGTGGKVMFDTLVDWTKRPEEAIYNYSGIATYRKTFEVQMPIDKSHVFLDLGLVKNIARVRLNGQDLGVVWTAPWRVGIGQTLKAGTNELEIEVANLWGNRLIGDAFLPKEQRRTQTNVRTYEACAKGNPKENKGPLSSSGLLGPVRVMAAE